MTDSIVRLRAADGASAEVHRFGAHVTSWRPAPGEDERLFLSARSDLSGDAAIRGGIPVIFPQFAAEGPLPRHGFARTSTWELESQHTDGGLAVATFVLASNDDTRTIWHAEFRSALTVRVGGDQLVVSLSVHNTGHDDISFTCALHTYIRVHDVSNASIVGLHGARFRVSGARDALQFDTDEIIRINGEVDRVYVDAPRRVFLREATREIVVEAEEFPDLVLWNPGARAASLADMEPGGERRMVCIEAAAVQTPIVLGADRRWSGSQRLTAVPMQG